MDRLEIECLGERSNRSVDSDGQIERLHQGCDVEMCCLPQVDMFELGIYFTKRIRCRSCRRGNIAVRELTSGDGDAIQTKQPEQFQLAFGWCSRQWCVRRRCGYLLTNGRHIEATLAILHDGHDRLLERNLIDFDVSDE